MQTFDFGVIDRNPFNSFDYLFELRFVYSLSVVPQPIDTIPFHCDRLNHKVEFPVSVFVCPQMRRVCVSRYSQLTWRAHEIFLSTMANKMLKYFAQ